jgi:replicative DNA helicase
LNRATEKQVTDYNVLELKDISSHFSTAVLGISSLNRSSYGYDISDSAFKESGAIEYGCDCLMGLQFSVLEKMDEDGEYEKGEKVKKLSTKQYEDEKKRPLRYLQVKVMKQRNGVCGVRAYLNFETAYSKFIPTTREEQGKMMNRKERELFG